ncbi:MULTISPECIES: response regulator transcription factor [Paenarthrobacter]|uniref:response regulator transcription factor n=1 Tax=Paenarthrobacter TaxID=1742992 RepID=UPI002149356A|nr:MULTISPECIES: response regulator transcription factor [Paenarthrobacter]MCR1160889.1 response regulator transcription factor [Paenarthrobacter sp. UW852]MDR6637296.1 DNA-binding NarL/FixJ family response regulator [Paenarthrobacter nitroguajacolicus]
MLRYPLSRPTIEVDIVEDHAVLREGLAQWIQANAPGIRVVGKFASWAEAAAHIGALSDVVVLDVLLGDHVPLRAKIQAILSAGPQVVVCSSVLDPAVMRQAIAAGALAYIPKTVAAGVVESAIRNAALGEPYITAEVAAALDSERSGPVLSAREHQVVSLYLGGTAGTLAETANVLGISVDGVKKHLASVRRKFQDGPEPLTRLALRDRLVAGGWLVEDPNH